MEIINLDEVDSRFIEIVLKIEKVLYERGIKVFT
jgi:hypothetical protein